MPNFNFVANTKENKEERGKVEALNRDTAIKALYEKGLFVTSLSLTKEDKISGYKFKKTDLGDFCRQMGSMLSAGIPLIKALNLLRNREMPQKIKNIYNRLYKIIQNGNSLSVALTECAGSFDVMLINMVSAGESSGQLDGTMVRMAAYYDKESRMGSKVKSAMVYPMILGVLTFCVIIAMFVFILPQFFSTFEGMELPLITKILMGISNFMVSNVVVLFIGLVLIIAGFFVLKSLKPVKIAMDKFKLHAPVIGQLNRVIYTSRFARTLSSLYSCGLSMIPALQISIKTVSSPYLEAQFDRVLREVKQGVPLSAALRKVDGFDSKLVDTVFIGEESGNLDDMLVSVAENFDYESEMATTRLVSLMEPLMIVVMAVIVGTIALAVMTPIMGIYKNVG